MNSVNLTPTTWILATEHIHMRIVVNHLTRMQKGCMCVAGIDLASLLHVRPVLDRQMPIDMLSVHGGPFDMGRIIDLGQTRFVGKVPEVEDQQFNPEDVRHEGEMTEPEYRKLLEGVAREKLGAIFGADLRLVGSTCAVTETHGLRSLGCFWARDGRLFLDETLGRPRVRFSFRSGDHGLTVPATDIRLYAEDHVTPCQETIQWLAQQIEADPRVLVSVGLSRPYRKSAQERARHWLQINNFHLSDNSGWTLLTRRVLKSKKQL